MKKLSLTSVLFFVLASTTLTGCDLVGDIFEAGFWVGIIILVVVVGLIIWLVGKFRG
jgi:hypothetical protein